MGIKTECRLILYTPDLAIAPIFLLKLYEEIIRQYVQNQLKAMNEIVDAG